MSTQAFIIIDEKDVYDEEGYIIDTKLIEEKQPLFDCWGDDKIMSIFENYGWSNLDSCMDSGACGLDEDGFKRFLDENSLDEYNEYEIKIINRMKKYFEEFFGMECNCY